MQEQEPLISNAAIQEQFDAAANLGVTPCAWLPPEWEELKKNDHKFYDTVKGDNEEMAVGKFFKESSPADGCIEKGRNADGAELIKPEEEVDDEKKGWVDPFSDFTHVDDKEFPMADLNAIAKTLEAESGKNAAVKPTNEKILERLRRVVGSDTPGMKRLERVFDWVLYRTTALLGALNTEAEAKNEKTYNEARGSYIAFLKDLDDHEPERKDKKIDPIKDVDGDVRVGKEKIVRSKIRTSGYGRTIKWTCLSPVIYKGKIYGARVIVHWNPHSSSNGIPIKHP